jgi:hypothetical protein
MRWPDPAVTNANVTISYFSTNVWFPFENNADVNAKPNIYGPWRSQQPGIIASFMFKRFQYPKPDADAIRLWQRQLKPVLILRYVWLWQQQPKSVLILRFLLNF